LIASRMAQLLVRNLDPDLVTRLKRRAAEHGRSTEAEHRALLRDALKGRERDRSFKRHLLDIPDVGSDQDFARARDRGRRVKL